jgi:hypothetical protein
VRSPDRLNLQEPLGAHSICVIFRWRVICYFSGSDFAHDIVRWVSQIAIQANAGSQPAGAMQAGDVFSRLLSLLSGKSFGVMAGSGALVIPGSGSASLFRPARRPAMISRCQLITFIACAAFSSAVRDFKASLAGSDTLALLAVGSPTVSRSGFGRRC